MKNFLYDSIIFDLDGTLWNASSATASAWADVAKKFQIDVTIDAEAIKKVSGLPFDQCMENTLGNGAHKIPNLKAMLEIEEEHQIVKNGGIFYPGMQEGIRKLSKNYKLFLVSNCQVWYLDAFFKHSQLREQFQDVLCFGHTDRSKKENILEIIKRHNLKNSVYVGDTQWDFEAAQGAGIPFIFAKFGFGTISGPSLTIGSIEELVSQAIV
jgi:phosphoglycolate phosphatase